MNKYRNKKTTIDGITFDSKREADRYCELLLLQKAGEITNLTLQEKYVLVDKTPTERPVIYKADFSYNLPDGRVVVEDVKGHRTKEYIIKRKLFKWRYPDIDFREV